MTIEPDVLLDDELRLEPDPCSRCGERYQASVGGMAPLIPTGFQIYDSTRDRDVQELDGCHRFDCPHDRGTVYFSRMLHGMGSLGEAARDYEPPLQPGEVPF